MEAVLSARIERKYVFAAERPVIAWLEHCLLRDPRHPAGTVSSIYYDTPRLDRYQEKRNGDFGKLKVRLRWYDPDGSAEPALRLDCYLETKQREGSLTRKERVTVSLPRAELLRDPFSLGELQDLPLRHAHTALLWVGALVPLLLVRFERRRFADPRTRARVSVDTKIRCDGVNRAFLCPGRGEPLGIGVLEIKGSSREGPPWLSGLGSHFKRQSFSKYAACVERLVATGSRRAWE